MVRRCLSPLLLLVLFTASASAAAARGGTGEEAAGATGSEAGPRIFFLALDAVPYDLVARLTDPSRGDDALFQGYVGPVPLISSFPSTSSVAFTGILEPVHLDRPPGYEARFFDRERDEIRGGGLLSYQKIRFPWRDFFTWHYGNAIRRAFATLTPVKSSIRELRWAFRDFLASDQHEFFGYVAMTDGAGHLKGPDSLEPVLVALDRGLRQLHRDHPHLDFRTVLYSDHGMAGGEPLANVRPAVKRALEHAGFRLESDLEHPDHAVLVPFGLVSSFEVYTRPGRGVDAAIAAASAEGVDLCAAQQGGPGSELWRVTSQRGDALIERRRRGGDGAGGRDPGTLWSYRPVSGDPLSYGPIVEELRRRAGDPDETFFPDSWWLEATSGAYYPDALYRLAHAFELVQNSASAVCSVARGHMYGAEMTELGARVSTGHLRWTHGALHRDASLGFLLTDAHAWNPHPPSALRFDRALARFVQGSKDMSRTARVDGNEPSPGGLSH